MGGNLLETPVLLIGFNRPLLMRRVLGEIRKAQPKMLFIAVDGPRSDRPGEEDKCSECRDLAKEVDWPCEVKTLFRDSNLGCKMGVSSAISWFFSQVDAGIILEDDCMPSQSFFPFAEAILKRYANDPRVMMVNGTNIAGSWNSNGSSYFFSKFGSIWGWATWRRAWNSYDVEMKSWADPKSKEAVRDRLNDGNLWKNKEWSYDRAFSGKKDSWDYQWEYAMLLNGGISIVPASNLIENIGMNRDSTHTKAGDAPSLKASSLQFPLVEPTGTKTDEEYDRLFVKKIFKPLRLFGKLAFKIKGICKK